MLIEPTLSKLLAMKLNGMAEAFKEQLQSTDISALSFEERLSLLVDHQWSWKENRALANRIRKAQFKIQACVEDIDYQTPRGLSRSLISQLSLSNWILEHQNCIISGPTGIGKTFIACALGNKACRNGFSSWYFTVPKLFREIEIASAQGKFPLFLNQLAKTHLLIIEDWGFDSLTQEQYRTFLEILDDRYDSQSTLITSQFPTKHWFDAMGSPTIADAILDRLIHRCYPIELDGPSMRKLKQKPKPKKEKK